MGVEHLRGEAGQRGVSGAGGQGERQSMDDSALGSAASLKHDANILIAVLAVPQVLHKGSRNHAWPATS